MNSLHRLLFKQLGQRLNATMSLASFDAWKGGELEGARRKGLLRELPGPVDCPSPTCTEGCTIRPVPVPEKGPGWFRLPCFLGRAADRFARSEEVTFLECRADKIFQLLCQCNEAELLFQASSSGGQAAVLVGRLPWANQAYLWFVTTARGVVGPAELAPVLAHRERPALVLIPPGRILGALDIRHLADGGLHLLEMDRCMDWELLELAKLAVMAELSRHVRPETEGGPQARLVLDVPGCEAFYLGQRLDLRPAEFGFLFAVAERPGATIPHDRIADVVAMVLNRLHTGECKDGDPGSNNKHKSNVVAAFKRLLSEGQIPKDSLDPDKLIVSTKGVGFRLEESSVHIRH